MSRVVITRTHNDIVGPIHMNGNKQSMPCNHKPGMLEDIFQQTHQLLSVPFQLGSVPRSYESNIQIKTSRNGARSRVIHPERILRIFLVASYVMIISAQQMRAIDIATFRCKGRQIYRILHRIRNSSLRSLHARTPVS